MPLICAVLVALGAFLFFFPDTAVVLSDRMTVLLPGNVGLGSAVAWLVKHPSLGLIALAVGLFVLARRIDRRLVSK